MWEVQLPNNTWSAYSPEISGSLNNTLEAGLRPGFAAVGVSLRPLGSC